MERMITAAWQSEEALLSPDVRGDADRVGALLASDFYEIGQSGRRFNRVEILRSLRNNSDQDGDVRVSEREARLIADSVVLLSYRVDFFGRSSRRSALWSITGGEARCLFHQGTVIPE
ncbi:DUF4440 domain-containing protein [Cryobacterium algoricola]|uniref:DUF4440 domain-containing protein n=1 Tax=Cryobacterium algoricola TaxID=1259183 RepID=A0ABY2IAS1_9MICO|nr:DUF4440 domain-containing protein [Cryobacterium algoricola]TFB83648.1 DUF4440 domain-containing protein [Cryobacterium algoricola]